MAGANGMHDLISWLIAEYVDLRTVQHLLQKNQELWDELCGQYSIPNFVPIDGQVAYSLAPDADQDARLESDAAGSGSVAQGCSLVYVDPIQTQPPQRESTASPLSSAGCRTGTSPQDPTGSFPTPRLLSPPPSVASPARLPRVVALMCSISPEQHGFSSPRPQPLPPDGSDCTAGPPNMQVFGQQEASVSLLTTQLTLKDPRTRSLDSDTVPAPYWEGSAPGAIGQASAASSPAGTEASKGQAYTVGNLAGGTGHVHMGTPQVAAHGNTFATGARERGSPSPAAPQGFPTPSSPNIQQLPQADSLFRPGSPPRALGQMSSPQEPTSSFPGAQSSPRASSPGPLAPQAPASPRGLQPPPPFMLQPPPPGRKAQKPPSPGPATVPEPAPFPLPSGPPVALPTWIPALQRPPEVPPKARKLSTNQETATRMSSNANSKDSKQETTEMALRLANRILCALCPGWANICGITVENVPKKVTQNGNDPYSLPNSVHPSALVERVNTILSLLKPLGHGSRVRPRLTEQFTGAFGNAQERPPEAASYRDIQDLRNMVKETAPPELRNDCLVLLSCLEQLSQDDGKPLSVW